MSPVVYPLSGVLVNGEYLPGHYWWTYPVVITGILWTGQSPSAGTLTLQLEINGVLTDYSITIPSGAGTFSGSDELSASVPAGQMVRWLASYSGTPDEAATEVALTMTVAAAGTMPPLPALTVRDGATGIIFYTYNPQTAVFTDVIPAGVGVNWALIQNGQTSLVIQSNGQTPFSVENGALSAGAFSDASPIAPLGNALAVFYVGNTVVGTVGVDGTFYAASLTEGAPSAGSALTAAYWAQFQFWSGGALTATLSAAGLTAADLEVGS